MTVLPRGAVLALLLVLAGLGLPPAAGAALRFGRCPDETFATCARVGVPVDHDRRGRARLSLHVERWTGIGRRRRGALLVLAGGPGQSASHITNEDFVGMLNAGLRGRDLIAFDQRGTGLSGALNCPGLERALQQVDRSREPVEAQACANRIGPRRAVYTTRQSVEDIEAVRRALGVPRISIFGVSYGTKLALAYARRYPRGVERLVLDSVLDTNGPEPLHLAS